MGRHLGGGLGPAGRVELVGLIVEDGVSERAAAAARSVAPATARRWKCRWWSAGEEERVCGRWALDRSSRPRRSPARTGTRSRAAGLRGAPSRGLGGETDRRHDRGRALHGARDPRLPRPVARAHAAARRGVPL